MTNTFWTILGGLIVLVALFIFAGVLFWFGWVLLTYPIVGLVIIILFVCWKIGGWIESFNFFG